MPVHIVCIGIVNQLTLAQQKGTLLVTLRKILPILIFFSISWSVCGQSPSVKNENTLAGVFQGEPIYIKNPYNKDTREFCVSDVYLNDRRLDLNYRLSALRVTFEGTDLFTPVSIRVVHRDSVCTSEIVNPLAVLFHSSYKFLNVYAADSGIYWTTEGEREIGTYLVEKLQNGIWVDEAEVGSEGKFELASYVHYPMYEVGPNKYRVKYDFGSGNRYLYSEEIEYQHYLDPVTFQPAVTNNRVFLSRSAYYELFDAKGAMILSGTGTEIDIRYIRPGNYVVYFDNQQPGSIRRNKIQPPRDNN